MKRLEGHIKSVKCYMPSCDPSHKTVKGCANSNENEVKKALGVFDAKLKALEKKKQGLNGALSKFNAETTPLGTDELANISAADACTGASAVGVQSIDERKRPVDAVRQKLEALGLRNELRKELQDLTRAYQRDVAQLKPRNYAALGGLINVWLPCDPRAAQEYARIKSSLEEVVEKYESLERYFDGRSCELAKTRTKFENLKCDTPATAVLATPDKKKADSKASISEPTIQQPPSAVTAAAQEPAKKPDEKVPLPPRRPDQPAGPATAMFDHWNTPTDSVTGTTPRMEKPAPDPVGARREPAATKNPDNWGTMSRAEWEKNDVYKSSISSPAPRVYHSADVDNFIYQAKSSGQRDYALRLQAALNETAMLMNGEGVGSAPSVFQDGVIGSRTRGAIDYYMSDPARREIFLRNLQAYGISTR